MALRDIIPALFADDKGQLATQDQIDAHRKIAQAMIASGLDTSPVQHWSQGAARLLNAVAGNMQMDRAGKEAIALANNRGAAIGAAHRDLQGPPMGSYAAPGNSGVGQPQPPVQSAAAPSGAPGNPQAYRDAVASIESAGSGNYSAIGPTNPKLGPALGRYGIMEGNLAEWSKAALGHEITADQFLADPAAQDAIFDNRFGGYVKQFGPEGAAQAWFAGPGGVGKTDRKDVLGTDVGTYGRRFIAAINGQPQATAPNPVQQVAMGGSLGASQQGQSPQQPMNASYFPPAPASDRPPVGSYAAVGPRSGADMAQVYKDLYAPGVTDEDRRNFAPMIAAQMSPYGFTTLQDGTVLRTNARAGSAEKIYSAPKYQAIENQDGTKSIVNYNDPNSVAEYNRSHGGQTLPNGHVTAQQLFGTKNPGEMAEAYTKVRNDAVDQGKPIPNYQEWMDNYRKEGTINSQSAYQSTTGKDLGERVGELIKGHAAYNEQLQAIHQMQAVLPEIYTGAGGNLSLQARKAIQGVAQAFGLSNEDVNDAISGTEGFQKVALKLAGAQAKALGGSRGTNFELDQYVKNNPGILLSQEGNDVMLNIMEQQARQNIDKSDIATHGVAQGLKPDGLIKQLDDYDSKSQIIDKLTGVDLKTGKKVKLSAKERRMLQSQSGASPASAPTGVDPTVWGVMTPEERALWAN